MKVKSSLHHDGYSIYDNIKIAFLIAFLIEENPFTWYDSLCAYNFDLWFVLVTADERRRLLSKSLSFYLSHIDEHWTDNIAVKLDKLIGKFKDALIYAKDSKGRRASDVANRTVKNIMNKNSLLEGRCVSSLSLTLP